MDSVTSPLFLQTLGPWFPNEMQNLLSSEKRTLDHWTTVQFFFSLAQVRCFWCCLCFRSGLVALFLKMSERGDSSFSSLLVKLSQVVALLKCFTLHVMNLKYIKISILMSEVLHELLLCDSPLNFTDLVQNERRRAPNRQSSMKWERNKSKT